MEFFINFKKVKLDRNRRGTLKMREWKHRENVWITKAPDSLCPQVDTNTDTDDADEMEDVSAAAAAPTAVDDNSAAAGPCSGDASCKPDASCL